ncbi:hypothetical protein D3C81_958520 [compost metagenome]
MPNKMAEVDFAIPELTLYFFGNRGLAQRNFPMVIDFINLIFLGNTRDNIFRFANIG